MVIHVAYGDLPLLTVDAIVNPGNSLGIMAEAGGITGRIAAAAGPTVEAEVREAAPLAIGAAIVTEPGELFCKAVIHVPIIEAPGDKVGVENVRRAARAALLASAQKEYATIAIPAIGSGTTGVPMDESARAIVDELRAHRHPNPSTVWLIASHAEQLWAFEDSLRSSGQG